jgi:hypothetical protein
MPGFKTGTAVQNPEEFREDKNLSGELAGQKGAKWKK